MSAVIVVSREDLEKIVEGAVRKALDAASNHRADSWLSIKATGLPAASVRKLIRNGTLRAAKVGRELRVRADDVQNYLESASAKKPEPEPAEVVEAADAFEAARARARARTRRSA